eukprot:IDg3922t1
MASVAAIFRLFETPLARLTGSGPFVSGSGGYASSTVLYIGSRGVGHSMLFSADTIAIQRCWRGGRKARFRSDSRQNCTVIECLRHGSEKARMDWM